MIWQNPLAWAGLAVLALPVLVHLLSRQRSRTMPFPTLRFIRPSQLMPVRRAWLADGRLLVVRASILVLAVAALAGPVLTTRRDGQRNRASARAIVVDTSASVSTSPAALDESRRITGQVESESGVSVRVETARPRHALAGAIAWLETQPARRELVIVSDFQRGTFDSVDLDAVPADIGIRVLPISGSIPARGEGAELQWGDVRVAARVDAGETIADWTRTQSPASSEGPAIMATPEDRPRALAARNAGLDLAGGWPSTDHRIVVAFPGDDSRERLLVGSRPPDAPWMGDLLLSIVRDPVLAGTAEDADIVGADSTPTLLIPLRTRDHRPVLGAARADVGGEEALILLPFADAGSVVSAALFAAAANALSGGAPAEEMEPERVPADVLSSWQREPADRADIMGTGGSDARWLWLAVLGLIALETAMRRSLAGKRTAP